MVKGEQKNQTKRQKCPKRQKTGIVVSKKSISRKITCPKLSRARFGDQCGLELPKGSNLKEAINLAGGTTPGGAINRVEVYHNRNLHVHNLSKTSGPILASNSIVIIPFMVVMDEPPSEKPLTISGTTPIPLDELKRKLPPKIKGEWVINSWRGNRTLDIRMGAGPKYRIFSIRLLPPDQQTKSPDDDKKTLYSITTFPIGHGYGDDLLAKEITHHLQELCRE